MFNFNKNNQINEVELKNLKNSIDKTRKRVNFQNIIRVRYIPKYIDICDCRDIWWTEVDRRVAMIFMNSEINTLLRIHPSMNIKQAKKLLYQPNNLRYYDPTNFV
jgi:hypothetical protein